MCPTLPFAQALPQLKSQHIRASVTPGKRWGPTIGFFAGWWNWLAWIFGTGEYLDEPETFSHNVTDLSVASVSART